MIHLCRLLVFLCLFVAVFGLSAADRIAPPKSDVVVPDDVRAELESGLKELRVAIDHADDSTKKNTRLNDLLPDIEVYFKAVDWALRYDEFFKTNDFKIARELLAEGTERAEQLAAGIAPWTEATGLVVRGYRSRIDGSVQPYGLVIPEGWRPNGGEQFRLDVWLHGRDDRLTELKFINQRRTSEGQFAPPNGFVLHPYGRNCNAFKFAGETDVFEAMEHVRKSYPIDGRRVAIRGFSMGGGGAWHLAAHHPGLWVAAAPGAGFSESPEYLGKFNKEPYPPLWEQQMWQLYNATDYALSFFNLPVVSYDGDQDKQKQAADMMQQAMLNHGLHLKRVTGHNIGHKYTPRSKVEINESIDAIVNVGKNFVPRKVKFETATLRYPQSHWVRLEGLEEHWKKARVDAEWNTPHAVKIDLQNVTAFSLNFGAGQCPLSPGEVEISVNGSTLAVNGPKSDRSWNAKFEFMDGQWRNTETFSSGLRKRPGLQGPIDDAWYSSFVMVPPSGEGFHAETDAWVQRELDWMRTNWRGLFRGDAPEKTTFELTEADISNKHLVLWGDPKSNSMIASILDRLPITWEKNGVAWEQTQSRLAVNAMPVMIYPNPLNPEKYVVINSAFTFRAMGSNADQTPKLPDYAIIDVTQPATGIAPGGVIAAGYFDENWR